MTAAILITGGAGYIGSHTVLALRERGHEVVVLDDLSEGHLGAIEGVPLERGSLQDRSFVHRVFEEHEIDSVVHFAASCLVGESVQKPGLYYANNAMATMNLLDAMVSRGVEKIVMSSTAATYGEVREMPITEAVEQRPVNPYGESKLVCERMLRDYHRAHGVASVALRYFNAAGAHPSGHLGEDHEPETHLIPLVVQAALGRRDHLTIHGDDWDTPDGTCLRDYVHVVDLAEAHILALESMARGEGGARAYNLGNTTATSVRDVIRAVEDVGGREVPHRVGPRRPGDPAVLVASTERIGRELGWRARYGDIRAVVETAWRWHETHPNGYGDEAS